jgi:hypothetical protein
MAHLFFLRCPRFDSYNDSTAGRIILTHDVTTMIRYAYERVEARQPMPGVFEVSRSVPIGTVIEDIMLPAEYSLEGEWEGQNRNMPLR